MDQLPYHIFKKILTKLSVSDLFSLMRVNRHFFLEVRNILRGKRNLWRDAAQSDLPPSVSSIFLEKLIPSSTSDHSQITDVEWQSIYLIRKKWKQCLLNNFRVQVQTLEREEFLNGPVTCIETHGNFIAVVAELNVYIYKERTGYNFYENSRYQFLFKASSHEVQLIRKIIFWQPDEKKNFLVIMSEDNQLTFWDLSTQRQVINRLAFSTKNLCVSSGGSFYTEYRGVIKLYEFKFAIVGKTVNEASFDTDGDDQYPIELISSNKNLKIIWPQAKKINIFEHYDNITPDSRSYSIRIPVGAITTKNKKYYLLSLENSKSIIMTYDDFFAIHQGGDNWLVMNMLETCDGRITSVLLHGDVLIFSIAKKSGREFIKLYSSDNFFRCQTLLDFYGIRSREDYFMHSNIFQIKSINDNRPCLAVATKNLVDINFIQ